ncbi:uncharacterized protein B0P05DRAFT_567663 [Gilbertella persicaria]|uniref:uncharacterized protein n=1 Tax=Gilbertella persicaria TaxID=101096 RepID=UPI00221E85DB|nr:uncharacterized protein B0P05DRAFT_567663 [Gilbertella persicaria]KAI8098302.1 hypothetical protein B0P05DRAFT_567663 [Gilbertella persicaria]
MSIDNLTIDFNTHLSLNLDVPSSTVKSNILPKNDRPASNKKTRNKQIVPSDDEDEDEEEDSDDDSDTESKPRAKVALRSNHPKPVKKSQPLPSDDEEEEEKEEGKGNEGKEGVHKGMTNIYYQDDQDDDVPLYYNQNTTYHSQEVYDDDDDRALVSDPNAGPVLTLVEGSHLQQLHYQQQQHQAQLAQFQYMQQQQQYRHHRASFQPHYHQQNKSMSGMDLLKQLEQEKADLKRGKPKIDTSNVKIEGLLSRLPEPGSHNISFQQLEQQQKKMMMQQHQQPRPLSANAMYYDPYQQQQQQQFYYNQQQLQIPQQQPYCPPRSPSPNHSKSNSSNRRYK